MKKIEKQISKLNSELLAATGNKYDLRNFPKILNSAKNNWGFSEIANKLDLGDPLVYKAFINDDERTSLKNLLELVSNNKKALEEVEKLLTRNVLYLGSECENLGRIDIENEFSDLEKLLTSKYMMLERVKNPDISNFIDDWDRVKPEIIFISCHGTKYGLYLLDKKGKCEEYLNTEFVKFFDKRSEYTECVVLSACESLTLGELITSAGKNVVCVNSKVDITTATQYTEYFFKYINDHSLENSDVYEKAHKTSMEKINFEGLEDSFSFKFLKADKIT
ncbi:hypothetical protein [Chryseobacterium sp.]|uniref:hypothetical protein n=1 Tax=Chryseobacterium sp. TaxID=1871047 RepID=UPI002FCC9C12